MLRVVDDNGNIGYADCHPWVELGDLPLSAQLSSLRQGKLTPLLKRSLYFATLDRNARAERVNLFQDIVIPKSHALSMDPSHPVDLDGFTHLKIKVKKDVKLPKGVRLRLDFGSRLSPKECEEFLSANDLTDIEFLEDPTPYSSKWSQIQQQYKVNFARDFGSEKGANAPFLVIKPAVQEVDPFLKGDHQLVVTSYLDHPIGQLAAAYTAALLSEKTGRVSICGLVSHEVYQKSSFSEKLSRNGPRLIPPQEGYGFGFDEELTSLSWIPLS
ncbi:MAG: hypothetical protein WDZ27_05820 [Waddliaceae bacterium]